MKATANELAELRRQIAAAHAGTALSDAEIAGLTKVHPSQVGRICRGDFKTISHSVVQICKILGLETDGQAASPPNERMAWLKLEASVRKLWDKTPEGADKIVRVLDTIGALREAEGPGRRTYRAGEVKGVADDRERSR